MCIQGFLYSLKLIFLCYIIILNNYNKHDDNNDNNS
jgi:hypothetical protein